MARLDLWRPRRGSSARVSSGANPLGELARIQQELEDASDTFLSGVVPRTLLSDVFAPALDLVDRGNEIVLRADLPGLEPEDIQIEIQDGTLTLRGEREDERQEQNDDYQCVERWGGAFLRVVRIPPGVDPNKIRAEFKNGILEVHMPKKPEAAPKKIEVKGEDTKTAGAAASGQKPSGQGTQRDAPAGGGGPSSK